MLLQRAMHSTAQRERPRTWADLADRPAILEPEPTPEPTGGSLHGPGGGSVGTILSAMGHWAETITNPGFATGETSSHPSPRDNDPGLFARPMQMINDLGSGIAQEGVLALLDPLGAIDRQDAQRDLASRFDIVEPGGDESRLSNELTAGELQRVARDYSNIRLGRSSLTIDSRTSEEPGEYEDGVMQDIGDIMQTGSGRDLVRQLMHPRNGAPTRIIPSASGKPDTRGVAVPGTGTPFASGARGIGSQAEIQFNGQKDAIIGPSHHRSDVALYHEMVHALHDVQGTTDMSFVERDDAVSEDVGKKPTLRAEHQATGLGRSEVSPHNENLYRSERRALALSGEGRGGDLMMGDRTAYRGVWNYASFFGL